jgi:hypothetical protein
MIQKANTILIPKGLYLANIRGLGYQVTYPDDYVLESEKITKQMNQKSRKRCNLLINAPLDLMSAEKRQQIIVMTDRALTINSILQGGLKDKINPAKIEINQGKE